MRFLLKDGRGQGRRRNGAKLARSLLHGYPCPSDVFSSRRSISNCRDSCQEEDGRIVKRFCHLMQYARSYLPKRAANGRASKTAWSAAIFPPLTWYHSAIKAVPAEVFVTMS